VIESIRKSPPTCAPARPAAARWLEECLRRIADAHGEGSRVFIKVYADAAARRLIVRMPRAAAARRPRRSQGSRCR
jgi:hypothetical protein